MITRVHAAGLRRAKLFSRDEDGSMVIFSAFIFVLILMGAGMAVDIMRFESTRTRMQNTLDRAILAAANMNQEQDPEVVVRDYFNKAGLSEHLGAVVANRGLTYKTVTATAEVKVPSLFMNLMGIDEMVGPASGTAEERISDIEISMVLDVSGSMNSHSRLSNMRNAASSFVDNLFDNGEAADMSISIVPYSTQVPVGQNLLSRFNVSNEHSYSHCVDFEANDFNSTAVSASKPLQRTGHFDAFYGYQYGQNPRLRTCETDTRFEVMPFSGSRSALKSKINNLVAEGNTSIDIGLKWGAALLDPAAQSVVTNMIATGDVTSEYAGRPLAYGTTGAMKVMVVMTDGVNTSQYYMPSAYASGNSNWYRNNSNGRLSLYIPGRNQYYRLNDGYRYSSPDGGSSNNTRLTWPEVWNIMTVDYQAYMQYRGHNYGSYIYYNWTGDTRKYYGNSTKNDRMDDICAAAKANGIVIFAIGFEVNDDSATIMKRCASSANHFFRVAGTEINEAFNAIATKIHQLRLIQ